MSDTLHIMVLLATAHLFAVMSPGPNQALILATAARNRSEGLIVAAGFWPAGCLWASMGLLGMGELMRSAPMIELGLRVACGLYLIYLGVRMFRASFGDRTKLGRAAPEQSRSKLFLMGFLTNLGNAKAMAYFAGVFAATGAYELPWQWQFVAIILMPGIGFSWNASLVLFVSSPPIRRAYERASHWIDRISGSFLLLFGLKLLVSK